MYTQLLLVTLLVLLVTTLETMIDTQLARLMDLDLCGAFKTMSPNFVLSHLQSSQLL